MTATKLAFIFAVSGLAWWRFGLPVGAFALLTLVVAIGIGSMFGPDDMDDDA